MKERVEGLFLGKGIWDHFKDAVVDMHEPVFIQLNEEFFSLKWCEFCETIVANFGVAWLNFVDAFEVSKESEGLEYKKCVAFIQIVDGFDFMRYRSRSLNFIMLRNID